MAERMNVRVPTQAELEAMSVEEIKEAVRVAHETAGFDMVEFGGPEDPGVTFDACWQDWIEYHTPIAWKGGKPQTSISPEGLKYAALESALCLFSFDDRFISADEDL